MRRVVALPAVMALAGLCLAQGTSVSPHPDDPIAPGIPDRNDERTPQGPGRKGTAPPRPADGPPASDAIAAPELERDPRARRERDAWRRAHPCSDYRYLADNAHRLVFATCLDDESHAEMARMVARQADQQAATLFDALPEDEVFVAIATPTDVRREFPKGSTTEGMYEHPRRRIVTADIGAVLRHEYTHAMHFGHMERLGQPHAMWVQEGLAALYERYELSDDGEIVFLPSHRHNQARTVAGQRSRRPIAAMVRMTPAQFMAASEQLYPVARSFFEFLADGGALRRWYRTYLRTFDQDRSGVAALEEALGAPLETIERQWRDWVLARPAVDLAAGHAERTVGIDVASATDGVAVRRVARGSAAQRAGLAVGDVITAVAGSPVRSVREWAEASAALRAPTVPLAVRRGAERLELVLRWDGRRADLGGEGQHPHGLDRAGTRAAALDRALHLSES
jgi:hypothetical protein